MCEDVPAFRTGAPPYLTHQSSLVFWNREQSASDASSGGAERSGRLMQEVGWQEGVIQSVANFMFQNRRQVRTQSAHEYSEHVCLDIISTRLIYRRKVCT